MCTAPTRLATMGKCSAAMSHGNTSFVMYSKCMCLHVEVESKTILDISPPLNRLMGIAFAQHNTLHDTALPPTISHKLQLRLVPTPCIGERWKREREGKEHVRRHTGSNDR